jgi:2-iminoacetate synthase ThiH
MLRIVHTVPCEGGPDRPGSWGVEDLTVVAAARLALPADVEVAPSWSRLGPAACQVAVAFGATAWIVPADDTTDLAHLADAIGRTVEEVPYGGDGHGQRGTG